jgi:transposase
MPPRKRFIKNLPAELSYIKNNKNDFKRFNIYFQDESRFGLFTRNGRRLTIRGVKPICPYHHKFENTYLYGAFSPITGSHLILDLPECNTDWFQSFLDELSLLDKDEFKIVILDNGAFHKAKRLRIPDNMALLFLPPYSPELNPAEKIWQEMKRRLCMKVFKSIQELQNQLDTIIEELLTTDKVKSLTAFEFYTQIFKTILN